jgi:hypothetical protein
MWCVATVVAQRHGGGARCCYPSKDLTLLEPFEPPPPWPVAAASPPCPRRGALVPSFVVKLPSARWDSYCCQFFSMMVSS